MEKNIGPINRLIRVVLGVVLIAGGLFFVRGLLGIVLAMFGAVALFSGSVGFCHVYKFLGTCRTTEKR